MKCVVLYEVSPEGLPLAMAHFPAHKALLLEFQSLGKALGAGTFGNPSEGAMGIFANRTDAEEFVAKDPFVRHGVVSRMTLRDWNDILG